RGERVALDHLGQAGLALALLGLAVLVALEVATLLVGGEEAAEGDLRARGREHRLALLAVDLGLRAEADRGGRAARVGHLRGDRALPDEVVELELVRGELARDLLGGAEGVARGADRLVR